MARRTSAVGVGVGVGMLAPMLMLLLAAAASAAAQQDASPSPSPPTAPTPTPPAASPPLLDCPPPPPPRDAGAPRAACCNLPINVSAEAAAVYPQLCGGFADMMQSTDMTNETAVQELRTHAEGLMTNLSGLAIAAVLEPASISNDTTIAGVRVWRATPKGASRADSSGRRRLLFYVHGGGYILGSCTSLAAVSAPIASASGLPVLCPEYRLAPEHKFPAGLQDVVAVYRELVTSQGYDARNIALLGDSAGGGLVMAALQAMQAQGLPQPGAAGLISPWVALSGPTDTYAAITDYDPVVNMGGNSTNTISYDATTAYAGSASLLDPLVSPVYGSYNASYAPVLIQVGLREVLLGDATMLHRRMRAAGACAHLSAWPGMWHDFQAFNWDMPEAREAQREMARFLTSHLGGGSQRCGGACCLF